jgi:hypothetical protein
MSARGPAFLLALGLAALPAAAQDGGSRREIGGITFKSEYGLGQVEGPDVVWYFSGNVTATGPDMTVRADRMIVWIPNEEDGEKPKKDRPEDQDKKRLSIRQLYAEGNLLYQRRDPKTLKLEILRVERLYYDFEVRRGYFLDFRSQSNVKRARTDVTMRAAEARLVADGKVGVIEGVDVVLSTCTFADPHYSVSFRSATAKWNLPEKPGPLDFFPDWKTADPKFEVTSMSVQVWGIPVFFWPALTVSAAAFSAVPIKKVQGGRSSRFGLSVETDWGVKISKGLVDSLIPWGTNDPLDDDETFGEFNWEVDWRQTRGWAGGLDPSWKWRDSWGYLDTYYLRDDGPDPDNDFDRRFLPLESPDRGRARIFHRHEIGPTLRLELESSWLSDRNLLEEFFEKEFKEGKEQETVFYIRMLDGNLGGYFRQRNRILDFQTQLEYLPQARLVYLDQPVLPDLLPGLTYSQELEGAHLRQRFDDALPLENPSTWRFDTLNTLVYALDLGIVTLSPFAEARFTAYENDIFGDPDERFIATCGARMGTEFSGVHDLTWDLVGLRRLRHIVQIEARYAAAIENDLSPSRLFPYDETDGRDNFRELALEMRNRFQTKVIDGEAFRPHEFLEVGVRGEYYPNADRDTVGFNPNNFAHPFSPITLAPTDATKILRERKYSNVHWDVALRSTGNYFAATASGEYNPVDHQEEVREYGVTVRPREDLALHLGQVFIFDVTNAFTFGARWNITEKWRVTADTQYDYKTNDFISRKGSIVRDFHDFQLEVVFEEDVGRDERKFYVTFVPTFLRLPR